MFSLDQIQKMISDNDLSPFYNDRYWRNLTMEIIKNNHNECTLCKQRGKYTQAQMVHHIEPLKQSPELAYNRDNLMPLCNDCHDRVHKRGSYCERRGYRNTEKW